MCLYCAEILVEQDDQQWLQWMLVEFYTWLPTIICLASCLQLYSEYSSFDSLVCASFVVTASSTRLLHPSRVHCLRWFIIIVDSSWLQRFLTLCTHTSSLTTCVILLGCSVVWCMVMHHALFTPFWQHGWYIYICQWSISCELFSFSALRALSYSFSFTFGW